MCVCICVCCLFGCCDTYARVCIHHVCLFQLQKKSESAFSKLESLVAENRRLQEQNKKLLEENKRLKTLY